MNEQQLRDLALNLYTSFFFFLIVLCFASFIAVLFSLIHNIKNRKKLQKNREFISEIIQTQEAERNRISRELHDTISQNIKILLLKEKELSAVLSDYNFKSDEIQFKIEQIIDLEKQNQKQLRTIIQNFAVPAIGTIPFKTVINDLCEQFKEQSGIDCSFFVSPDVELDDFSKTAKTSHFADNSGSPEQCKSTRKSKRDKHCHKKSKPQRKRPPFRAGSGAKLTDRRRFYLHNDF